MDHSPSISQLLWTIYGIIFLYFLLGGVAFYWINRNKPKHVARESYLKFFVYVLIIHLLFFSILFRPVIFRCITLLIIAIGIYELLRLFTVSGYKYPRYFFVSIVVFIVVSIGFYRFSGLAYRLVLYGFLVASIFDSFSQISGQLMGRRKIFPLISPNKTLEGLVGGGLVALISGYLLGSLYEVSAAERLILVIGIIIFSFAGDLMASMYKRKYGVKDFSRLIPGHGGILDRFDSLIACGFWVALYFIIFDFN